jgi:hypothetical protein
VPENLESIAEKAQAVVEALEGGNLGQLHGAPRSLQPSLCELTQGCAEADHCAPPLQNNTR